MVSNKPILLIALYGVNKLKMLKDIVQKEL